MTLTALSLVAGLVGALAWLLGDMFLVGFAPVPPADVARYQYPGLANLRLALYMTSGSDRRLRWGVWLAQFSIWLPLLSLYGLWQMASPASPLVWSALLCLLIGFSLSPLAHGAFYVVAMLGKAYRAQHDAGSGTVPQPLILPLVQALNQANHLLNVTWLSALAITYLGWLLYAGAILLGQTQWPQWLALANPLVTTLSWLALNHWILSRRTALFNGAALNLGLATFYGLAWMVTR